MSRVSPMSKVCLIIALAGAVCVSARADDVTPPAQIIQSSIRLQAGDAAMLALANNAPATYVAIPGTQEFSGEMIVRPLQPDALAARGVDALTASARVARALDRLAPITIQPENIHKYVVIRLPAGVTENQMHAFLMGTGDYEYAEPNYIVYPVLVPNDASYSTQQYAHQRVNSEPAWDITTGSSSVIIAITDTGIQLDHQDLAARLVPGANSAGTSVIPQTSGGQVNDINSHGTHCAGIAAGIGNNSVGIAGMGWNNRIMPIRVSNSTGGGSSFTALQSGATWAAQNGARIVSTSYSGVNSASNQTVGATLRSTYNTLWFWAAGNANSDLGADNYPDVMIVMSTDSADAKSSFSNFGAAVDLGAPGSSIFSTVNGSSTAYGTKSGTSMACPAAAGVAALILSVNTNLSAVQVRDILLNNVDDLGTAGEDNTFGRGRVNSGRAIADAYRISFPSDLPFSDDFETGNFQNAKWVYRDTGANVSVAAFAEPSGTRSANVNVARRIETNAIRLAGNSQDLRLRFATQHRGPASGESLAVEYLNTSNAWVNLATITSNGTLQTTFVQHNLAVPNIASARHNKFAVRFRSVGNSIGDNWYIDDVSIRANVACAADFNSDNQVDFFDYLDFSSAFADELTSADFNRDGIVDFFDYLDFADAFARGC
ncbi:MAG: S8 family serine peptidase [Planctomycetota bacterium]|nr:S8 family serine peptidase [Planctomycetota bacterium]